MESEEAVNPRENCEIRKDTTVAFSATTFTKKALNDSMK